MNYALGIDIGSTTNKFVLRKGNEIIYEKYERHFSQVRTKLLEMLGEVEAITGEEELALALSGSAGLGIAQDAGLPFVQEVFATGELVKQVDPNAACVIELGGEDAKIIFFDGGLDERMNGSCAGGTGAFIDQMATLLDVDVETLDRLSLNYKRVYPIASRCGVFAKTDIQPLLNQGASKEDIARSIYQSVVNQTIAGLARGKKITGRVLFLGGPLYFCKGLRACFADTLGLSAENTVFPDYARFSVALGAALYAAKASTGLSVQALRSRIENAKSSKAMSVMPQLFTSQAAYDTFCARHSRASVPARDIKAYQGSATLGIDCGSTTTKLVLLSDDKKLLYTFYAPNQGNPVAVISEQLKAIYALCGDKITIRGCAVTGYGEELIQNAFGADSGIVETIAHYTAAKHFKPDVDFILDIGGQDIKCFKIKDGAIDSIMLNEACSSGCGSFLETFAKSMGYSIADFAQKGLFAARPVNLGSRCTIFMNSSVKQSQKDGASVEDISAGLSISVVKNAIYKVIRAGSADELGENIVVQGGTFYNDAVLRAFEMEFGREVTRPDIAGLMGAFGAALYARRFTKSSLISLDALKDFTHTSTSAVCKGCTNRCHLTINTFAGGKRYISGNRCEKGLGLRSKTERLPNLYHFKRDYLTHLQQTGAKTRGKLGLPLALGMYELLPLWHTLFDTLGFEITVSDMSTRATYEKGQFSIPSDTACYPAKIMHGHIAALLEDGVDAIFYPCLTYNVAERGSDNHYNCPVVAYYAELLAGNVEELKNVSFLYPYLRLDNARTLARDLYRYLKEKGFAVSKQDVLSAAKKGFAAYKAYMQAVRRAGEEAIASARKNGQRIMILAGRPYHIDSEICHGIDDLANLLGFAVVSEDSVAHLEKPLRVRVLNQWTYHARLYRAARYATKHADTELVQLVSFGCGVDAITTDEVRRILEENGKLYTQLKIDEITNLGAVKIRLRSMLGALEERSESLEV